MADFDQAILDALNEGHSPQDIFDNFKNSKNPEKRKWYEQYSANMADRSREPDAGTSSTNEPNVSTLEYISNLSPAQKALGVGGILAGSAALGAATYYGKKQIDINAAVKEQALKNQLPLSEKDMEFQRQNDISQRRLDIEERRLNGELASPELTPVERIRLEREQLRLEAERKKFEYDEQVRQNNILKMAKQETGMAPVPEAATGLPSTTQQFSVQEKPVDYSLHPESAYAKQSINQPTGAPNLAAPPPADIAPAPVQPKPVDPLVQAKIDSIAADQRRKDEAHAAEQRRRDEAHANKLAADAKRAETKVQGATGTSGATSETLQLLKRSETAAMDKANDANAKAIAKVATSTATPAAIPTATTSTAVPKTTTEVSPVPAATTETTTAKKPPKWPGGPEGSAIQLFGGTKKNFTPESQASLEMFKDFVGKPLSMPPTGGSIHQIEDAGKFYEKYTGKSLPRSPEGKLIPIPEPQIKELHAGIKTELEDAIKGNKLGTLGKGAMAAAALLGLTGAVQAAQKGDFGPLREAGFDIGGPVALGKLGIAALSRAAGTGFSAATYAGNLNEGEGRELARRRHEYQMQESQKLGSPLRSVPPPR
jgi:hypothetical protein